MPAKTAKPRRRGRPAVPADRIDVFLAHLGETASVAGAAARADIQRSTLYQLRQHDEAFAARWDEARKLGIERLEDEAMQRSLDGVPKPVFYAGQQVASVRQFNDRLLQFLLKAHKPETYDRPRPVAAAPLPFDLVARVKEAEARMNAKGDRLPPPEKEGRRGKR